jgi:hypothetical protein
LISTTRAATFISSRHNVSKSLVAVFVACREHQQSKTDDVGEAVRDLIGGTWVFDSGGQTRGDAKALFDCAQHSISRNTSIPPSDDTRPPSNFATTVLPETGDRPGRGSIRSGMAGTASRKWRGLEPTTKSYAKSPVCATSAHRRCIVGARKDERAKRMEANARKLYMAMTRAARPAFGRCGVEARPRGDRARHRSGDDET